MKIQELLNVIIPILFLALGLFIEKIMRTGKYDYLKIQNWRLVLWLGIVTILYLYLNLANSEVITLI